METFGGDAFVGDPVQVGDALFVLFVSGRSLDTDHLRSLRLDQVDQIQRRRSILRRFFDHHLVGDQLEFVIEGGMPGIRFGGSGFVVHRRQVVLDEVDDASHGNRQAGDGG